MKKHCDANEAHQKRLRESFVTKSENLFVNNHHLDGEQADSSWSSSSSFGEEFNELIEKLEANMSRTNFNWKCLARELNVSESCINDLEANYAHLNETQKLKFIFRLWARDGKLDFHTDKTTFLKNLLNVLSDCRLKRTKSKLAK
jgi:hypothetical protein